jgi:hypothetical protein
VPKSKLNGYEAFCSLDLKELKENCGKKQSFIPRLMSSIILARTCPGRAPGLNCKTLQIDCTRTEDRLIENQVARSTSTNLQTFLHPVRDLSVSLAAVVATL